MPNLFINAETKKLRESLVGEIKNVTVDFASAFENIHTKLQQEFVERGSLALLDHLRTCSSIPESYGHDSSEEKLYSKYTDAIICGTYNYLGLNSVVLRERADAADVEAACDEFSFVGDAKAFRLSRTAKNQKDFKVQAMYGWRRANDFAMVVCPIYQLPNTLSQIYQQAINLNVCIFTYSHLAVLVRVADLLGKDVALDILHSIFRNISNLNPSKVATNYWANVNHSMLADNNEIIKIWGEEKVATIESIDFAKEEGLHFLSKERTKILRMSHNEALQSLLEVHKLASRESTIRSIRYNNLLDVS